MPNEKRINIAFVKTEMEKFMKDNDMSLNESVDYILNNLQDPKCKKCYKILSNNEADKIKNILDNYSNQLDEKIEVYTYREEALKRKYKSEIFLLSQF